MNRPVPMRKRPKYRGMGLDLAATYIGLHPYILEAAAHAGLVPCRHELWGLMFDAAVLDRWRYSKEYKCLTHKNDH